MAKEENTSMLDEEVLEPTPGVDDGETQAKRIHANAQQAMKAHFEKQIADGDTMVIDVPDEDTAMGKRAVNGYLTCQINGYKHYLKCGTRVTVPRDVGTVFMNAYEGLKAALAREKQLAASAGQVVAVIPPKGEVNERV